MGYIGYFLNRTFGACLHKFNADWDRKLNEILDDYKLVKYNKYTVTLEHKGDLYEIWIANYPYASHRLEFKNKLCIGCKNQFRPSIRTCMRFDKLIYHPVLKMLKDDAKNAIADIYK